MGKTLNQLSLTELKAELNKRGLPTAGSKNDLIIRLQDHLTQINENLDTFQFEVEMTEEQVSTGSDMSSMMSVLLAKFEKNLLEQMEAQRNEQKSEQQNLLEQMEKQRTEQKSEQQSVLEKMEKQRTEQKSEQQSVLEKMEKMEAQQKNLLDEQKSLIEGKLDGIENKFVALDASIKDVEKQSQEKFEKVEEKLEKVEIKFDDKFKGMEVKIQSFTEELDKVRKIKIRESSGEYPKKKEMHPPTFDGQSSWSIYKKQFEAAATTNGWDDEDKCIALTLALRGPAAELLQTLPPEKNGNFNALVQVIEKRFGDGHMQEVFRVQLNSRVQKRGETLQQLQADIERLTHLAYPTAGDDIINQFATEAFVRAVSDIHLQRAIRTAGKRSLPEALAFALTMEAAEQASQGVHRVREVAVEECSCQKLAFQRNQRDGAARCWNCNKTGHLQRQCRLPPKRTACQHCGNRNIAQQQVSETTNTHPQLDSHSGNE